jgi:superfamily II DNA or RNA helicase
MLKTNRMMSHSKREDIQKEALEIALRYKNCGLGISMGVGKTKIGLDYIQYFYQQYEAKVLIVAPKLSIFTSWKDDLVKFGYDPDMLNFMTFTTYLSLNKQDVDYDLLILDECHNLLETHLPYLSQYTGRILGLSGTPPRYKDSIKGQIVNRYCPIRYTYITNDAVDDKILNDYEIYVHYVRLNTVNNIPVETKKMKFYTSEVKNYEYWTTRLEEAQGKKQQQIASVMRMRALMNFKSKESYARMLLQATTDKCIIFCNTQEQADKMCHHSYHTNNINSQENLLMFKEGTIDKLSCVLQLSEGVTIPDLKIGIILHAYGNERKSNQRIGRLLRLNPEEKATIHILCYQDTIDQKWVNSALADLDPDKIHYVKAYESSVY